MLSRPGGLAQQGENAAGSAVEAAGPALSALRVLREARSFTQLALARRSGVSARTICAVESGKSPGRMDVRRRLLHALNVPFAEHRCVFGPLAGERR
jgi:transcriptional regulator with XRE-family HTH domain